MNIKKNLLLITCTAILAPNIIMHAADHRPDGFTATQRLAHYTPLLAGLRDNEIVPFIHFAPFQPLTVGQWKDFLEKDAQAEAAAKAIAKASEKLVALSLNAPRVAGLKIAVSAAPGTHIHNLRIDVSEEKE